MNKTNGIDHKEKSQILLGVLNDLEDGYYEVDLNGNLTFFNDPLCVLIGYPEEEMMGMNNRQYMSTESAKTVLENFNCVYTTGEPVKGLEFEIIQKQGETRWVEGSISLIFDQNNKPSGFKGIVRDISRRRLTESALRRSEKEYRLLVENATEGILIIRNGIIEYANPHILELTGYSEKEMTDRRFIEFIRPEDQNRLIGVYSMVLKGEEVEELFSFKIDSKNGDLLLFQAKGVLVTWRERPAVLTFLRDITSQNMLESRLRNAQKMEAIGTLAGGIAHDFNNILGSIMLNSELALDDAEEGGEIGYSLEQILKASHRAKDLVEQILTFSRNSEVDKRPLNISSIIKETTKMMRAMFPSTILIHLEVSDESGWVNANPTQIQQLILNLATNSAHAMSEHGGILEIYLKSVVLDASDTEKLNLQPGNYSKLTVTDTGHGIESDLHQRIFDPFFTTKNTGEGTGLGLSVVHGIVENHEGAMNMNNTPGKGTEFNIFFPTIEKYEGPEDMEKQPISSPGNKQILFVDDEEALRDAGARMLEYMGYNVTAVSSGIEALDVVTKGPGKIDLIITDMTMPGMTGVELSTKLLKTQPDIPIILCTGYHETATQKKVKELGIQGYLSKPYSQREMAKIIRDILG
jgi:PAS domain S-box-containing protein